MTGFIHTDTNSRSSLLFNQSPSFNAESLELHSETRKFAAQQTLPTGTRILDGYLTNAPEWIDGSDKTKKAIFEIKGDANSTSISYGGYNDGHRGKSSSSSTPCSKNHPQGLEDAKALITSGSFSGTSCYVFLVFMRYTYISIKETCFRNIRTLLLRQKG